MKLIDTWEEWCAVYNQPDFWRDEIRLICAAHGVELRQVEGVFPGTHVGIFINDDTVLKIFCPVRFNTYWKELRLHRGILSGNPIYPQVRFHGVSPSGYHYIAFSRLHGTPLREVEGKLMSAEAIRSLAHALAELHNETMTEGKAGLRCLVHYDLGDDHVFLDDKGRLEGIIDFGDAVRRHPSAEFAIPFLFCLGGDVERIAIFHEAYHAKSEYRINDREVAAALRRHPFYTDIIPFVQRLDTEYARFLLRLLLSDCR